MDLIVDEIEYLIIEFDECRKKVKIFKEKFEKKNEFIIEDMLRDDEFVKIYMGLLNFVCFNFIWNLI